MWWLNFVPPPTVHHFTTALTLLKISNHRETGVCDSANLFGPMDLGWRNGGRIHDWTLCGRCYLKSHEYVNI